MAQFDPRVITVNPKAAGRSVLIGLGLILLIIFLWASVAYVPPGSVGVLTFFGRVTGEVLPEGTHFVSPFKVNHVLTVRTQTQEEHTSTPSSEGLNLEIDTSLIYHLSREKAADVFQRIGTSYGTTIIDPNLRSIIRDTTAGHSAHTPYARSRTRAEDEGMQGMR